MDISRNHLVADIDGVPADQRHRYTPVPAELHADAIRALQGSEEVTIPSLHPGRLATWAHKERNKLKREKAAKRKQAKASRRKNRP